MAYTTIDKPSDYFNTKLYTGNGSTQSITGINFQPDWVWIKGRDAATSHQVYDVVRGTTKRLITQVINAEDTATNGLTAFDSDGFSLGTDSSSNASTKTYVAWNWLADNTSGSSNTDGSITSTVSANTTAGFSIVKYSGGGTNDDTTTVGHGLGAAPNFISVKCINTLGGWQTSSTSLGWNNVVRLENTSASASSTYAFGVSGVTPSSTTFTVSASSGDNHTNTSGNDYIAYCFANVKGYSKFGKYTGNNNADGTFVYTGFKPAMVILKHYDSAGNNWRIFDNKRDVDNIVEKPLYPSVSNAEATGNSLDFLSNGFKLRTTSSAKNNGSYIYMSFASNPFVTSTGIPTTAR